MAKQNLLIVDADQRSLKVLEVSLRKAGYSVTTCASAEEALDMAELSKPDLIVSDTRLPKMDGFEMVRQLRKIPDMAEVPLMFLSSDTTVESKVQGLQLGVADYLTKPIYIKEIITRVQLELQRRQREGLERRSAETKTRFSGSLADMGLVDLLQTIDISRKSGILHLTNAGKKGAVHFVDGTIRHAYIGKLEGDVAVYRFLVWGEGEFDLEFRPVTVPKQTVAMSTQGLLMEGMRRLDEWGRLLEQLPPLDSIFEIATDELTERLAEIPDEVNAMLRLFDGRRSLLGVVDECGIDDLEALTTISKLYFEGLIFDSGVRASEAPPPELGEPDAGQRDTPGGVDDDSNEDTGADADDASQVVPGQHDAMEDAPPSTEVVAANSAEPGHEAVPIGVIVPDPAPGGGSAARSPLITAPAGTYALPSFMSEVEPVAAVLTPAEAPSGTVAVPAPSPSVSPEPEPWAEAPVPLPPLAGVKTAGSAVAAFVPQAAEATDGSADENRFQASEASVHADAALVVDPEAATAALLQRAASRSSFPPASQGPFEATGDGFADTLGTDRASMPGSAFEFEDEASIPGLGGGGAGPKRIVIGLVIAAVVCVAGYFLSRPTPSETEHAVGGADAGVLVATTEATDANVPAEAVAEAAADAATVAEGVDAGVAPTVDAGVPPEAVAALPDAGAVVTAPVAGDYAALIAQAGAARGRQVEELYRQALAVNPSGSVALVELGFAMLNRGNNQEARDLALRATAVEPTSSKAWITLAAALQALGQRDESRAAYRTCADTATGEFVSHCRRFAR